MIHLDQINAENLDNNIRNFGAKVLYFCVCCGFVMLASAGLSFTIALTYWTCKYFLGSIH